MHYAAAETPVVHVDTSAIVTAMRELDQRLAQIETTLDTLMSRLFEVRQGPDAPYARKGIVVANAETARRARVGRRAKLNGFTFSEWVRVFGEVEQVPPGVDAILLGKIRDRVKAGDVRYWTDYDL